MQGDHAGPRHVEHSRTIAALGRLTTLRSSSGNKNEQQKNTSESGNSTQEDVQPVVPTDKHFAASVQGKSLLVDSS